MNHTVRSITLLPHRFMRKIGAPFFASCPKVFCVKCGSLQSSPEAGRCPQGGGVPGWVKGDAGGKVGPPPPASPPPPSASPPPPRSGELGPSVGFAATSPLPGSWAPPSASPPPPRFRGVGPLRRLRRHLPVPGRIDTDPSQNALADGTAASGLLRFARNDDLR